MQLYLLPVLIQLLTYSNNNRLAVPLVPVPGSAAWANELSPSRVDELFPSSSPNWDWRKQKQFRTVKLVCWSVFRICCRLTMNRTKTKGFKTFFYDWQIDWISANSGKTLDLCCWTGSASSGSTWTVRNSVSSPTGSSWSKMRIVGIKEIKNKHPSPIFWSPFFLMGWYLGIFENAMFAMGMLNMPCMLKMPISAVMK